MGTYRRYTVETNLNEAAHNELIAELLKNNDGLHYLIDETGYGIADGDWRDQDEAMIAFSKLHPEIMFTVHTKDEGTADEDNEWMDYYQHGRKLVDSVYPTKTWPEVDLETGAVTPPQPTISTPQDAQRLLDQVAVTASRNVEALYKEITMGGAKSIIFHPDDYLEYSDGAEYTITGLDLNTEDSTIDMIQDEDGGPDDERQPLIGDTDVNIELWEVLLKIKSDPDYRTKAIAAR